MNSHHTCQFCFATFSNSSHRRRHEASHVAGSLHDCYFCNRRFSRHDAARRHARTCPGRKGRAMPPALKKGKPRTSCDQCARNKLGCDRNLPCGPCQGDALTCTYTRVVATSQSDNRPDKFHLLCADRQTNQEEGILTPHSITPLNPPDTFIQAKGTMVFLLKYYDADNSCLDIYHALEIGRLGFDQGGASPIDVDEVAFVLPNDIVFGPPEGNPLDSELTRFLGVDTSQQTPYLDISRGTAPCQAPKSLSGRAVDVVKELSLIVERSGRYIKNARSHLDAAVSQCLFSVTNFIGFTQLYTRRFHRHCPIIHLPTFHMNSATSPLLLAVFLAGSILSYPRDTYELAIDCLDLAEEYIFDSPLFKEGNKGHRDQEEKIPVLVESLQAATIITFLQMGRSNDDARQRARKRRMPQLILAARTFSLFGVEQGRRPLQHALNELEFSQEESLLRTATYIYLLDCQYIACFRCHPLITISECTECLPSSESKFSMGEDCLQKPKNSATGRSPSLVKVIDMLMADVWCGSSHPLLCNSSIFGLFTVVCALNSMIFSAFASRTDSIQRPFIKRALARWRLLWDDLVSRTSAEELQLVGFMKSATEVWLLANAYLQIDAYDYLSGLNSDSTMPLYSILGRIAGSRLSSD